MGAKWRSSKPSKSALPTVHTLALTCRYSARRIFHPAYTTLPSPRTLSSINTLHLLLLIITSTRSLDSLSLSQVLFSAVSSYLIQKLQWDPALSLSTMGGSNPVVLVALLTAVSLVITIFKFHDAPHKVPIWWDLHAHAWGWAPRWFGLFFLPVLTFLVPYALYQAVVNSNLESHGHESKHSIFHVVVLPAIFLFIVQTFVLLPAAVNEPHDFPARTFVANIALWLLIWLGHNIKHVEPNPVIGVVNPWTTTASWDSLHGQVGLLFEVAGVVLFILAFFLPIGWPLTTGLIVLWLGPWIVAYALAFFSNSTASEREPLVTN